MVSRSHMTLGLLTMSAGASYVSMFGCCRKEACKTIDALKHYI